MKNIKYISLTFIFSIIVAILNYYYIESINRLYSLPQHVITFAIGVIIVYFISLSKSGFNIYSLLYMIPFGFAYWIPYDITLGILLTGNPWHLGTTGIDVYFTQIFINGFGFFIFKLFWFLLSLTIINRLFYYSKFS